MNANIEFLNYIYQNTSMGIQSIRKLLITVLDDDIIRVLKEQLEDYKIVEKKCNEIAMEYSTNLKKISQMTKFKTNFMIKFKTLFNISKHHIAEMMIKGSIMGIRDIKDKINKYSNTEQKILDLANQLLVIEENNLKKLENI